ncbi:SMI1/KNR4 family protein [Bordetella genomosp. 5]|uniref:SMI1/KNR4 family protein n=1 Tax=Bordetella genomosp. 5 TaxID=1395608 RepID=UPI000B9DFC92|nr:SMI1/KNR4 family protein [Bordetella genomosp. 5]OZI42608.1 SMI1/KNR4 family protein [Bordetella genomosp. 5]
MVTRPAHGSAFADFDIDTFWEDHAYSRENYVEPAPDDARVAAIEAELGYRLPSAYIELARHQNGGVVARNCFPMDEPTSWADDHVAITGLYAIGRDACYSLCGELGSPFMMREWGYPDIGVVIATCPSAGHDVIMLDYRDCGPQGEPRVVHVDQEDDYRITVVAANFAEFIHGLVGEEAFDDSEAERAQAIDMTEQGSLSPIVIAALAAAGERLPDGEQVLRALARRIVEAKGHFSLHTDPDSHLMYALMFWLYTQLATPASFEAFVARPRGAETYDEPSFELMIVFNLVKEPFGLRTGGYAQDFVRDWWNARVAAGDIVSGADGFRMSAQAERALLDALTPLANPA